MRISIMGLGKLGAPACVVMADLGHEVIGYDVNADIVHKIDTGVAPVEEPGLQDGLTRYHSRISATSDAVTAVTDTEITMIIVPTPSQTSGAFDTSYVSDVLDEITLGLKRKNRYHLVVITSTVMPGDTTEFIKRLEELTELRCSRDFGVCYNPEFIALGSVINDMRRPDFILIGESDVHAGDLLQRVYYKVPAPIVRMGIMNAELAKISLNAYVTMKISFANQLANMCELMPGGDADIVLRAIGLDRRIGGKYFRGALGFGGPCFPRDNRAFQRVSRRLGLEAPLAEATDEVNAAQSGLLAETVRHHVRLGGTVAVLGLTYKPFTPVTEESQSLRLAATLAGEFDVRVFDPAVKDPQLPASVKVCSSVHECVVSADLVVVATAWPEFQALGPLSLKTPKTPIIDCWNVLSNDFPRRLVLGKEMK